MLEFTYTQAQTEIIFRATTPERLLKAIAKFSAIRDAKKHLDTIKWLFEDIVRTEINGGIYFILNEGAPVISMRVEENNIYFNQITESYIIDRIIEGSK